MGSVASLGTTSLTAGDSKGGCSVVGTVTTLVWNISCMSLTAVNTLPDIVEFQIRTRPLSTPALQPIYTVTYVGCQGEPMKASIPVVNFYETDFIIRQHSGTTIYDWNILAI